MVSKPFSINKTLACMVGVVFACKHPGMTPGARYTRARPGPASCRHALWKQMKEVNQFGKPHDIHELRAVCKRCRASTQELSGEFDKEGYHSLCRTACFKAKYMFTESVVLTGARCFN